MKNNFNYSALVANPTEKAWSQAYSTLNIFITIGIEQANEDLNIAVEGKKILDKLQKEYFSLTAKNLPDIKYALEETVKEINPAFTFSVTMAAIFGKALYLVIAGAGNVILKRNGKTGIIGKGEEDRVKTFSGYLDNKDVVLLATKQFSQKIPPEKMIQLFDGFSPSELAENIAPIIHGNSLGSEAAIIFEFKNNSSDPEEIAIASQKETIQKADTAVEDLTIDKTTEKRAMFLFLNKIKNLNSRLRATFLRTHFPTKKTFLLLTIIILVLALLSGVAYEKKKQRQTAQRQLLFNSLFTPAKKDFEEGVALLALNKNLAAENFSRVITGLQSRKTEFRAGSKERQTIESLIQQSQDQLNSVSALTPLKNQKELFTVNSSSQIKNIAKITARSGQLLLADGAGGIFQIDKETGAIKKSFEPLAGQIKSLSADANYIYALLENSVERIDKKSAKAEALIANLTAQNVSLDTFLGNIYLLNSQDKNVEKYAGPAWQKAAYFTNPVNFTDTPIDMTIDGSIFTLNKSGNIKKFTRGSEDAFTIKGLIKPFSANSAIYTDREYSNLYLLDKENKRLLVLAKSGELEAQYDIKDIDSIISFTLDEPNKNIFVATPTKLYKAGLQD